MGKKGACMLPTKPQHTLRRARLATASLFFIFCVFIFLYVSFFMVCLYHFYPWTNFQNDALYFIQFLSYVKCMLFRYPIRNVFVIVNRQKITKPPLYNLLSCINCNTFTFSPTSTQPLPMPCLQQTRLQHMPLKCMHRSNEGIKTHYYYLSLHDTSCLFLRQCPQFNNLLSSAETLDTHSQRQSILVSCSG